MLRGPQVLPCSAAPAFFVLVHGTSSSFLVMFFHGMIVFYPWCPLQIVCLALGVGRSEPLGALLERSALVWLGACSTWSLRRERLLACQAGRASVLVRASLGNLRGTRSPPHRGEFSYILLGDVPLVLVALPVWSPTSCVGTRSARC